MVAGRSPPPWPERSMVWSVGQRASNPSISGSSDGALNSTDPAISRVETAQLVCSRSCRRGRAIYWLPATCCLLPTTGYSLLATGYWLLATGYWLLAAGYWLLATGYWLLATGYWLLATCRSAMNARRPCIASTSSLPPPLPPPPLPSVEGVHEILHTVVAAELASMGRVWAWVWVWVGTGVGTRRVGCLIWEGSLARLLTKLCLSDRRADASPNVGRKETSRPDPKSMRGEMRCDEMRRDTGR